MRGHVLAILLCVLKSFGSSSGLAFSPCFLCCATREAGPAVWICRLHTHVQPFIHSTNSIGTRKVPFFNFHRPIKILSYSIIREELGAAGWYAGLMRA